jgi:hypothetical protein
MNLRNTLTGYLFEEFMMGGKVALERGCVNAKPEKRKCWIDEMG